MANSRNIRKAKAKARKAELAVAVANAFAVDKVKVAERNKRYEALIAVNHWGRKGTSCVCHPGIFKVA